jgi:hypothetical protein
MTDVKITEDRENSAEIEEQRNSEASPEKDERVRILMLISYNQFRLMYTS